MQLLPAAGRLSTSPQMMSPAGRRAMMTAINLFQVVASGNDARFLINTIFLLFFSFLVYVPLSAMQQMPIPELVLSENS